MSDNNQPLRRYLATAAIYLALVASVFGFNVIRSRAARAAAQPSQPETPTVVSTKPYFSLTTNRTYSPNESARLHGCRDSGRTNNCQTFRRRAFSCSLQESEPL